jgi:hypothetical protein
MALHEWLWILSQPALAWLKVRYYAEVLVCSRTFNMRKYVSLSLPLYGYLLVVVEFSYCDGWGRELAEVPWQVPGSRFVTLILYLAWWRSLVQLADQCVRLQLCVPVVASRRLGYVRAKSCFGLEILNSVLVILNSVLVIALRRTGHLSSWHFSDTSFEPMWGIGEWGRGWLLPVNFEFVCYVESD